MTEALAIVLKFLGKYWQYVVIVALALGCWHFDKEAVKWRNNTDTCETGRKADQDAYKAASAAAKAQNKAEVTQTENNWKQVVNDNEADYKAKLDAAHASVAAYAKQLRDAQANTTTTGNTGSMQLPETPQSAQPVDGTSEGTLIPASVTDLNICAENTIKAESWQSFYNNLQQKQKEQMHDQSPQ